MYEDNSPISQQTFDYRTAAEVLASWLENYRTLTWVPIKFATMPDIYTFPSNPDYEGGWDRTSIGKNHVNGFRARQRVYRRHGWPGNDYQREVCRQELQCFEERLSELHCAYLNALLPYPKLEWTVYHPELQGGLLADFTHFLEDAAGEDAV